MKPIKRDIEARDATPALYGLGVIYLVPTHENGEN